MVIMNINCIANNTAIDELRSSSPVYSNKKHLTGRNDSQWALAAKTVKWLLQPESSEELPMSTPGEKKPLAGAGKILFWLTVSIGASILLGQLGG